MIALEERGALAVLRLERPPVNALDLELLGVLQDRLDELEAGAARAVVLTGSGRCFSAGVDLLRLVNEGADYARAFVPQIDVAFRRLFAFPKPVVAAVNGHAVAGGCVLAFACDHRLMTDGASTIGVPELVVGVPWPPLALEIVRFAVPHFRAQELVYSGRTVGPDEARRIGIVEETVDPEHLLDSAIESAERLAAIPAEAFRLAKVQLRGPALAHAERRQIELGDAVVEHWAAADTRAAIEAYLERTIGRRGGAPRS